MPNTAIIEVNPDFKPTGKDETEQFAIAKKMGEKEVTYTTAVEAVQNSNGMYRLKSIIPDDKGQAPVQRLEDKPIDELKVMMLSLGIKTEKQMKKSDIVMLIQKKLDEIDVIDE